MSYQYPYTQGNLSVPPTPPTPYSWETTEVRNNLPNQLELQDQPAQHALNPQHQGQKIVYSASPPIIELQEHVPIVPSQHQSEDSLRLHHFSLAAGTSTRRANVMSQDMRPHIDVDTARHVTASASPPSAGGVHSVGPVRARASPAHNVVAHPYRRPHSANPRRDNESNLRMIQSSSSSAAGPSMLAPSASGVQTCIPASIHRTAIISPAHVIAPISTNTTFTPRADYFFCSESRVSTALFELPGVKKSDLKIELSVCQNGVKQVSISGEARQPLPDGMIALKERKYGKFRRVLPVHCDTKKEDITVNLEDGVLTLRIQLGPPLDSEQESEMIPIP